MTKLDTDTLPVGQNGNYRIRLQEDWCAWFPNGGYLAAIALRAVGLETQLRWPASITCQFLNVGKFDEAEVFVSCLKRTSVAECHHVSIVQARQTILTAQIWICAEVAGFEHQDVDFPAVDGPERNPALDDVILNWPPYPFLRNLEQRAIDFIPWETRTEIKRPRELQWIRFRSDGDYGEPFLNCCRTLILIDMVGWDAAKLPHPADTRYIAPTLGLTADFHAASDEPWLLTEAWAPVGISGRLLANNRVWDRQGRLLASGSTTMLCRRRPARLGGDLEVPRDKPMPNSVS